MKLEQVKKRAKLKAALVARKKQDPRYKEVLGRLRQEGFIFAPQIAATRSHPTIDDALWVGEIEPRVLELLPAIILRRKKIFLPVRELPEDLKAAINGLRRANASVVFRGVPPEKYAAWEAKVRKRGSKKLAQAKQFRFQEEDLKYLAKLKKHWALNETDVLRRALRESSGKI